MCQHCLWTMIKEGTNSKNWRYKADHYSLCSKNGWRFLIYLGKTTVFLPSTKFPGNWHITFTHICIVDKFKARWGTNTVRRQHCWCCLCPSQLHWLFTTTRSKRKETVKDFLKRKFELWYSDQMFEQRDSKFLCILCSHWELNRWWMSIITYIQTHPKIIKKIKNVAGIIYDIVIQNLE